MKKILFLITFTLAFVLYSCNDDPAEAAQNPEANPELRTPEDDFYDLFKHSSAQGMPLDFQQENAFKTVFAAAVSQLLVEERYQAWDVHAAVRVPWDISDDLYLASGGTRATLEMDPREREPGQAVPATRSDMAISSGIAYQYMVQEIYDPYKYMFHSVPETFKDFEFQRFFLLNTGMVYDPTFISQQCAELRAIIDAALEFRDPAIFNRPFDNCFSMEDGCLYLISRYPAQRRVITALQKALEACMGIPYPRERVDFITDIVEQMERPENEYIGSLIREEDAEKLKQAIVIAAVSSNFWKVHYGMEEEGAEPPADAPVISVDYTGANQIPHQGATLTFTVTTNYNGKFACTSHPNDAVATPSTWEAGTREIRVVIAANTGSQAKNLDFVFTCLGEDATASETFRFVQDVYVPLELTVNMGRQSNFASAYTTQFVASVVTNGQWSVSPSVSESVIVSPATGTGSQDITVTILPNASTRAREINLNFTASREGESASASMRLYQSMSGAANTLTIADMVYLQDDYFPKEGGTKEYMIITNAAWNITAMEYAYVTESPSAQNASIPPVYTLLNLGVTPNQGVGNKNFTVTCPANNSDRPNDPYVHVYTVDKDGRFNKGKTMSYLQYGEEPVFGMSPSGTMRVVRNTYYTFKVTAPEWMRWQVSSYGVNFTMDVSGDNYGTKAFMFQPYISLSGGDIAPMISVRFYYKDIINYGHQTLNLYY